MRVRGLRIGDLEIGEIRGYIKIAPIQRDEGREKAKLFCRVFVYCLPHNEWYGSDVSENRSRTHCNFYSKLCYFYVSLCNVIFVPCNNNSHSVKELQ